MNERIPPILLYPAILAILSIMTTTALAQDKAPSKALLATAKISRADAEKIAPAAMPNATVKEAEFEEEDGGLHWSFDRKTPGGKETTEVGVDAVTSQIVENKMESEKDEAREKDSEKKEH